MIARMWRGPIPRAKKDAYVTYLKKTGLKDYGSIPGNLGVYLLARDRGDETEVVTLTFWDSIDAIKKFAGEDYDKARYYPEDEKFLTKFEPLVEHYEVVVGPEQATQLQEDESEAA